MSKPSRVLVVDDNPVVLIGVCELLRAEGCEVFEARSGAEALKLAEERMPDLVLLDVMLPDGNGVELCQRIKSDPVLKTLFVVLLSATETSTFSQVSGLEAGADGYIARPIGNRELLARIESLLRIQRGEAALRRAHDVLEAQVEQRTSELAGANVSCLSSVWSFLRPRLSLLPAHFGEVTSEELHPRSGVQRTC